MQTLTQFEKEYLITQSKNRVLMRQSELEQLEKRGELLRSDLISFEKGFQELKQCLEAETKIQALLQTSDL